MRALGDPVTLLCASKVLLDLWEALTGRSAPEPLRAGVLWVPKTLRGVCPGQLVGLLVCVTVGETDDTDQPAS